MTEQNAPSPARFEQAIDEFWDAFPSFWHAVRAHIDKYARDEMEITEVQFHILRRIHKGKISIGELAEIKHISRPAISQIVDVLVEKGLVTRKQDERDRRYVYLSLTKEGDAVLEEIFAFSRGWMAAKFSTLQEDEIENIIQALRVLKTIFR